MHPAIIITIILSALIVWSILGVAYVVFLDLFGRRYDYDLDYQLTKWQMFKAGPLVWFLEWKRKK